MDLKLISNVGWLYGQDGNGMIYAGKTPGGTYFLAVYYANTGIEKWKYLKVTSLLNYVAAGQAGYASDLDLAKFTSQEIPDFVDSDDTSGGAYTLDEIINEGTLPVKWNGENAYKHKAEGVTDAEIAALKTAGGASSTTTTTTGGTTQQAGILGGIVPSASEFNTLFSDPLGFIQRNIMFVVLILGVVYYMRRKKRKPLWII